MLPGHRFTLNPSKRNPSSTVLSWLPVVTDLRLLLSPHPPTYAFVSFASILDSLPSVAYSVLLRPPRNLSPHSPLFFFFFFNGWLNDQSFLCRNIRPDLLIYCWFKSGHKASARRWDHDGRVMFQATGGSTHSNLGESTPPCDQFYLTRLWAGHSQTQKAHLSPPRVTTLLPTCLLSHQEMTLPSRNWVSTSGYLAPQTDLGLG